MSSLGAPPDFGRSVNPISTRGGGTDYAHLTTTGTPGFSDLPTAMLCQASGKRTTQFLEGFILVCVGDLREH